MRWVKETSHTGDKGQRQGYIVSGTELTLRFLMRDVHEIKCLE